MNTFGKILTLTTFGESHGTAMGGVLDGMPAGVGIDMGSLQRFVDSRRPDQGVGASGRGETDRVEVLSGIWQGKTLGSPIGFIVRNVDARSDDYGHMADCYRPSHADFTTQAKYGIRDPRGGGRASARETVLRVVAGGIAIQALQAAGITIEARVVQVGSCCGTEDEMRQAIAEAAQGGDTLGGIVECIVKGVPAGLGEPVYGKLHARLASAMMSINAVHGFEYGDGFAMAAMHGSDALDLFEKRPDGSIGTATNHSGGIQGGISNGEDITMRIAFKPVPTLMRDVPAVDRDGNHVTLHPRGRHDVCVLWRALPVVEAMAALVILDNYLLDRCSRWRD